MLFALRVGGEFPTKEDQGSERVSEEGMATLPEPLASGKAVCSRFKVPLGGKSPLGVAKRQREIHTNIESTTQGGTTKQHIHTKTLKTSQRSAGAGAELVVSTSQEALRCDDAVVPVRLKANVDRVANVDRKVTECHEYGTSVEERMEKRARVEGKDEDVQIEELVKELKSLKVDVSETIKCRTKSELIELFECLISRRSAISDGDIEFKDDGDAKHDCNFKFDLTDKDPRLKAYPDRTSPFEKDEIIKQVEKKYAQGIVEKSSAPWSSNCVLVTKNGKSRLCIDYRKLNGVTVKDNYLLPTCAEVFDALGGSKFLTSIDAVQAYHQIPIKNERDRDLTTFVVPGGGLYRFKRMPFGLANAGAVWSRFIDGALEGLRWQTCVVYADDILVYTKTDSVKDHVEALHKVFDRLDQYGIKVKGDKIKLALKELPFLGQIVGVDGCKPDPSKVKAVADLEIPTTIKQLRRVMGMFAYYRKYVPDFASIAAPLYSLCGKNAQNARVKKGGSFIFDDAQNRAFTLLKKKLTEEPVVLAFCDWNKPFEVHCDASDTGLGAVLYQVVNGERKVLAYGSKMLTEGEKKYLSYEKEALALVWSLDLWEHYLKWRPFKVITDCRSLV